MGKIIDLTDKEIGDLVVIKRAEDKILSSGNKQIMWLCRCKCGNEFIVRGELLRKNKVKSCGCKKTKPESDWDKLYEYVRHNVMNYDKNQSLSTQIVIRLKGLLQGKYCANNNITNKANYSYETILNTFKFCNADIQKSIKFKSFKNEMHKFNYILKIVEPKINDIYIRMQNVTKAKDDIHRLDTTAISHTGASYKPKTENHLKHLKELW